LDSTPNGNRFTVRGVFVLVLAMTLAVPASAVATGSPNVIYFPGVKVLPRQDGTAHGRLDPSITLRTPAFCWELDLFTRRQPLNGYLRRAGSGREVARWYLGDNHVPPQPWPGSAHYSGCAGISRADQRAFLRRPRLYYVDIRTRRATHAAVAHPHGPRLP
jgi:hypothetical protein